VSVNVNSQKLLKIAASDKPSTIWKTNYFKFYQADDSEVEEEDTSCGINFKVMCHPDELEHLSMVWNLVLNCNTSDVVPKSVNFLIKCFMSLCDDLSEKKAEIQ